MAPPADPPPTRRLVDQRMRNRIIEYLQLAGSFEEQLAYERDAPIAFVPAEVINQWQDWVPTDPRTHDHHADVYTEDEVRALRRVHAVWERVVIRTPDPLPPLSAIQGRPEWDDLRQAAISALQVFARRGMLPEDHEA